MRSRLTTFGVLLTLGIARGGLPAEGRAAQAMLSCPGMAQAGQPLTVEVTIAVGTTPLGAYSIVVGHDPAVLTLASVAGGHHDGVLGHADDEYADARHGQPCSLPEREAHHSDGRGERRQDQ